MLTWYLLSEWSSHHGREEILTHCNKLVPHTPIEKKMASYLGSHEFCNLRVPKEMTFQLSPVVKGTGDAMDSGGGGPQAKGRVSASHEKGMCKAKDWT